MSLVKWFRKNNSKIMAIVVIVLMIGFIGGTSLSTLLRGSGRNMRETLAYYKDDVKITAKDLNQAANELNILQLLNAETILKSLYDVFSMNVQQRNIPNLHAFLLSELLFSDQGASASNINYIKSLTITNLYRINEKQIHDIYRRTLPSYYYWFCLSKEAESAGIRVSNESTGEFLGQILPQIHGRTYRQVISSLRDSYGITEDQILTACGKLLAVFQYSHISCTSEDMTIRQLKNITSYDMETIDIEYVIFDPNVFADEMEAPTEEEITEQFNKYKDIFAGSVSEENPHGFGYKLSDRVQFEYIALKLSDVSNIVPPPTQEEIDTFYSNNRSSFTEQVPSDPNDPNSALVNRIKPPSEVQGIISRHLKIEKANDKAQSILIEARNITEAALQDFNDAELASLSNAEFAEIAGDYESASNQLREQFQIPVFTGKTGLLNALDIDTDEYLPRLGIETSSGDIVGLARAAFAIEELSASELGPHDIQKPRIYQNIGIAKDSSLILPDEQIMVLLRIVDATKAAAPENVDYSISKHSIIFDPNQQESETYSVREKVTEDLLNYAALDITYVRTEEFGRLAVEEDWQNAIDQFNTLYGRKDEQDLNDIQETFILRTTEDLPIQGRVSKALLTTFEVQSRGNPAFQLQLNDVKISSLLMNRLFEIAKQDNLTLPKLMLFNPKMQYYFIKSIKVNNLWKQQYEQNKSIELLANEHIQSQSLAVVHLNPENILNRMKFKLVDEEEEPAEPEEIPAESESSS